MKRFVSTNFGLGAVLGLVTAAIVAMTQANAGETYLIAFAVGAIGLGYVQRPNWLRRLLGSRLQR